MTKEEHIRAWLGDIILMSLPDRQREYLHDRLEWLCQLDDAERLLRMLLARFERDKQNPFVVPGWELYDTIGCYNERNRIEHVRHCLGVLGYLKFELKPPGPTTLTPIPILSIHHLPLDPIVPNNENISVTLEVFTMGPGKGLIAKSLQTGHMIIGWPMGIDGYTRATPSVPIGYPGELVDKEITSTLKRMKESVQSWLMTIEGKVYDEPERHARPHAVIERG